MQQTFDVVVLGAGAAGLFCAIEAGKRGRRVAVLERAGRSGKKILISGGGRCNFTNLHCSAGSFLSGNPHFCKSALARYPPADFLALVEKHGIRYHEKTLGQLFCDHSAQEITGMLERECAAAGVRIFLNTNIREVAKPGGFVTRTDGGEFGSDALVVATGGLSIPKMGATALGYELARQFGLEIREPWPALVPLTFSAADGERYGGLAGVSTEVIASCGKQQFRESLLFTHRGLSGPAVLQISSYWKKPQPICIDIAPGRDLTAPLRLANSARDLAAAKNAFRAFLPKRLADCWVEANAPPRWTNQGLDALESAAHRWEIYPEGTEGYEKAEVTAGGVSTAELSAKTMESRNVAGLYFVGEVVDVTGQLGGYNFQWAWASGFCAGQAV
jgi:hypothetical protein